MRFNCGQHLRPREVVRRNSVAGTVPPVVLAAWPSQIGEPSSKKQLCGPPPFPLRIEFVPVEKEFGGRHGGAQNGVNAVTVGTGKQVNLPQILQPRDDVCEPPDLSRPHALVPIQEEGMTSA